MEEATGGSVGAGDAPVGRRWRAGGRGTLGWVRSGERSEAREQKKKKEERERRGTAGTTLRCGGRGWLMLGEVGLS